MNIKGKKISFSQYQCVQNQSDLKSMGAAAPIISCTHYNEDPEEYNIKALTYCTSSSLL